MGALIRDRAKYGDYDPFFGELVGNRDAADGNNAEALGEAQVAGLLSPEPSDDDAVGKDGRDESSFMQGQSQQPGSDTCSFPIPEVMACAFAGEALACSWMLVAAAFLLGFVAVFGVIGLLSITACKVCRQLAVRLGLSDGVQDFCRPCTEVLEEPAEHGLPCGPQHPRPVDVDPVCEVCLTFARVPYRFCSFCGARPSYHHGRCCVEAPDCGKDASGSASFFHTMADKG